jgi:hypothetical protein
LTEVEVVENGVDYDGRVNGLDVGGDCLEGVDEVGEVRGAWGCFG